MGADEAAFSLPVSLNRRGAPPMMLLIALVCACACGGAMLSAYGSASFRWARSPDITVISADGDAQIEAVREAVAFWSETFAQLAKLGSAFLQHRSERMPASLERIPGDLVIVSKLPHSLSDRTSRPMSACTAARTALPSCMMR